MNSQGRWRILDLGFDNIPKILIRARFSSGYQIELTDLSRVWSESLSKQQIVQRASEVGSSMDPGEDEEQFEIFIGKIEKALNREDETSLHLHVEDDGGILNMELSSPLPHPLPPFKWNVRLQRQPEEVIDSELVTPLVLQVSNLKHQMQHLIEELRNKDRVILKICDRLETSGNDLTTVFPGVSNVKISRKKGQREQLARHVKGLEDFNESTWKTQIMLKQFHGSLNAELVDEVFEELPSSMPKADTATYWWKNLGTSSQFTPQPQFSRGHEKWHDSHVTRDTTDVSLPQSDSLPNEFQRQDTPPHVRHRTPDDAASNISIDVADTAMDDEVHPTPNQVDDESTTDDDDDLDAAPRKQPSSQKSQSATQHSPLPLVTGKPSMDGNRSSRAPISLTKESTPEQQPNSPKTRPKLGTIGGKSKVTELPQSIRHESESMPKSPPAMRSETKNWKIGGKRAKQSDDPSSPPPPVEDQRSPEPIREPTPRRSKPPEKSKTPAPHETPEELADRKRDQLKQELEAKAKAPAKKKRKF